MNPICLITPPSPFLLDERVFMTLGILRVAAVLEQAGRPVEMLDLSGIENAEAAVRAHVGQSEAQVYGLTATTPQMPAATKIVSAIREVNPGAKIILGGPHITLVNAARKREVKNGIDGRAQRAFAILAEMFDVMVAGDGEDAIFHALMPDAPKLVDGDDAASALFLTNERLDAQPMPARHLVDVESYHYSIEGFPSVSLIGQLGCLAAGTQITMADGSKLPIEKVQKGDKITTFDEAKKTQISAPVVAVWERGAEDLWEVLANNSIPIFVTSEHPIWTREGWKTVENLGIGEEIGVVSEVRNPNIQGSKDLQPLPESQTGSHLPNMRESISDFALLPQAHELLQEGVPQRVAEGSCQREVASCGAASNESQVGFDDRRGTSSLLEYRTTEGRRSDSSLPQDYIRFEEGRPQPNETPRSSPEGLGYAQEGLVRVSVGKAEEAMGCREDAFTICGNEAGTKREGKHLSRDIEGASPIVQICGQSGLLDRSVRVGNPEESGFCGCGEQESDTSARRVLAFGGEHGGGHSGLRVVGLGGPDNLDTRTSNTQAQDVNAENSAIRFEPITSKRFIGPSKVYNITVCPAHSYIANGILVHNCPYMCSFCGGRNSPMLRRIRNRSVESIVAEVRFLHERHGFTGFMFYDDELNVSKSMIPLMNAIYDLQQELGVEFRLRGFIKSNLFTDAQAEAMYRAGFRWILVGFESGSPRILENIQKKATREQNTECMNIARRQGLKVKALMSVGHAGESEETIMQTRDWLLEQKPDDFDCSVISTYPGTSYYDDATESLPGVWTYTAKNGDTLHSYELDFNVTSDFYKGNPDDGYKSYVYTDYLESSEIVRLRDFVERDVRAKLNIPFNPGQPGVQYEASMGQRGKLPPNILRTTRELVPA